MLDSNIAVYAHDVDEGGKQQRATRLIEALQNAGRIVVSTQVLNEFYSAITRRSRKTPLSHGEAAQIVNEMITAWDVVPVTPSITRRAPNAILRHRLPFWDALIWAAAREHAVPVVYSEDFPHETSIEGVRFLNPFRMPEEVLRQPWP